MAKTRKTTQSTKTHEVKEEHTLLQLDTEKLKLSCEPVKKLALMFHYKNTGQAIKGLQAIVSIQIADNLNVPLGKLATDHMGYMSFDISHVNAFLQNLFKDSPEFKKLKLSDISELSIANFLNDVKIIATIKGIPTHNINILDHHYGIIKDALFADINIETEEICHACPAKGLISMQNPSLTDWLLSPSSFAINPSFFIGADGCENLYPANFATQEFRFFQIIRSKDSLEKVNKTKIDIRTGWSLEYLVAWQPLGHTLGQIIYSLPLAPGEIVNIAVIDWARKSIDSRYEDLSVEEQLKHNTHRDRSISETVEAALHEWQRGGSVMGGLATSIGGFLPIGSLIFGGGSANSLGGGYSTSSGNRDVTASTIQQISDAFSQTTSALRELRSTIVIQSDQKEHAEAKTRVVANHNHSHSLTMLYYEVLRHYKVTTEFMRVRPSLLVSYAPNRVDFNDENSIIKYRKILESVLIDERYLECFSAVQKYLCAINEVDFQFNKENRINEGDIIFNIFRLIFVTGGDGWSGKVNFYINTRLQNVRCRQVGKDSYDISGSLEHDDSFEPGNTDTFIVESEVRVKWGDILSVQIFVTGGESWDLDHFSIEGQLNGNNYLTLFNGEIGKKMEDVKLNNISVYTNKPLVAATKSNSLDKLAEEERCCLNKLKKHLVDNSQYYNRAIWLLEDPNERAVRFSQIRFGDIALIDLIDNRPIDVFGNYVVFPSRKFHEEFPTPEKVNVEKLMTLPTRGVFSEAKLGRCNASEEIDDTRFWDWQKSPITENVPGIEDLNINESRNVAQNLTPSQFPASIVNIVTPQNLPDPSGMANVMNLLGKSDIFRDMSVSKQVEDLLKKLSDNSISIAEAATKANDIQKQRAENQSDTFTPSNKRTTDEKRTSPEQAQKEIKVSENQANKGTITKDEHKENVTKSIANMTGGSGGSLVTVTVNFKHAISGPLDGEFEIEFIGPVGDGFYTKTAGGVGAGTIIIKTGEQYTIQIRGKRTKLPISLESIAHIPSIGGDPAFDIDVSNHITNKEVPIEANIVAMIPKGKKYINLTVVADEVAKDIDIEVKVSGSGTLKTDLEVQIGLIFEGIDLGHIKAGVGYEITLGTEVGIRLPIEYKRLTGTVKAEKNDLEL